jgi:hypothetical protein
LKKVKLCQNHPAFVTNASIKPEMPVTAIITGTGNVDVARGV